MQKLESSSENLRYIIDLITFAKYFKVRIKNSLEEFNEELSDEKFSSFRVNYIANNINIDLMWKYLYIFTIAPQITVSSINKEINNNNSNIINFRIAFGLSLSLFSGSIFLLFTLSVLLLAIATNFLFGLVFLILIIVNYILLYAQLFRIRENVYEQLISMKSIEYYSSQKSP